jgi:CRISPR-associated protein Cas2
MSFDRINAYRNMWVLVLFDLPTETKKQRRTAGLFRKDLLKDGFTMFQFSIYLRFCPSQENADVHIQRTKKSLPSEGKVGILAITDRQWARMELFYKGFHQDKMETPQQLEMF